MKLMILLSLVMFQSCLESTPEKRQFPAVNQAPTLETMEGHFVSSVYISKPETEEVDQELEAEEAKKQIPLKASQKPFFDPTCFDKSFVDYLEAEGISSGALTREMVHHIFISDDIARITTTMKWFHEDKLVGTKCNDPKAFGTIKKEKNVYQVYFKNIDEEYHAYSLYYDKDKLVMEDIRANLEN